jgi:8-amino-7-oxononanoate synthase
MFTDHQRDLDRLADAGRRRELRPRRGIDFSSNDYLALAAHPAMRAGIVDALERGVAVGSGGSRLLRGNDPEHEALEAEAAAFFGSESALYLSGGYAANTALLSTLPQRGDLVVHDALVHASMHEGLRLSRGTAVSATHNDAGAFERAIRRWRNEGNRGRVWIAAESLYSMDGDVAPLGDLADVADRHDAVLLIDEAHATGVFGPDGRGLAAHLDGQPNLIVMRTCGKALGCEGALICAPRIVRDFLVNRARGFIFATAPSPLMAAAVRVALRLIAAEPERRQALQALVRRAGAGLSRLGFPDSRSPIIPLILGADRRATASAAALQDAGFDVRAIRPPTVPEGTSRLRVSVTLNVNAAQVDALIGAVEAACLEPAL